MTALDRHERFPRTITLSTPLRLPQWTHVARGAGLFAVVIGGLAFLGWAFAIDRWTSLGGEIAMKANTSVALVLSGLSLLLLDRSGRVARAVGVLCAAVAALIGGLTLGQHVFGYDAGIDQLLFHEPPGAPATASPGRMGPPASTGFFLGGIALVLLHSRRALRLAQAFASVVVLWSFFAIVAYAYGARELFGAPSTGVALHTAVSLLALGLGMLAARFDRGLTAPFVGELGGAVMARRLLPIAVLFPFIVGWLRLYGERTGLFELGVGTALFVFLLVVTFVAVIWRSATVINQAQSTVVEARRHLEMALASARMGTWSWDVATGKVEWSDNLAELHGLAPGSFRGTLEAYLDCVHPEDRARVEAAIRTAVESRTAYELEFRVPFPDGSTHWVAGYGQVFVDARGNPTRLIGIGRDVTERRVAGEELAFAYAQTQEALRIRDTFLSVAGHEFRTPLSALGLTLHNLSRRLADSTDTGIAKSFRSLKRQAERLEKLTEDLLEVGRIRSGRLLFEPGPVELCRLVEDVVERFREAAALAGSAIKLSVPGPVTGTWDASRLDQVLSNLLANALKFGAGQPIEVAVGCDGSTARVSVRDHGIGISPEDQVRIFDRFERVGSAGGSRGLGLGLWIARQIVDGHGGRITVASEPGRGSTFTVELPGAEARA